MPNSEYVFNLKRRDTKAVDLDRLRKQGDILTSMIERVPSTFDRKRGRFIDLACGPGEWALKMAKEFPYAERIIGIDSFKEAVDYANAEAQTSQRDVEFYAGDVLQRLPYEDNTFDLVNARLILSFMPANRESWVAFVRECYRICRPGGMIQLTEADNSSIVGAPAFHRMAVALYRVLYRMGKTFSEYEMGVAPLLREFVEGGGFKDVQRHTYSIDYSANTDAHDAVVADGLLASLMLGSALARELGSEETYKQLYAEMEAELSSPDFRALWFLVRVTGRKPL